MGGKTQIFFYLLTETGIVHNCKKQGGDNDGKDR